MELAGFFEIRRRCDRIELLAGNDRLGIRVATEPRRAFFSKRLNPLHQLLCALSVRRESECPRLFRKLRQIVFREPSAGFADSKASRVQLQSPQRRVLPVSFHARRKQSKPRLRLLQTRPIHNPDRKSKGPDVPDCGTNALFHRTDEDDISATLGCVLPKLCVPLPEIRRGPPDSRRPPDYSHFAPREAIV